MIAIRPLLRFLRDFCAARICRSGSREDEIPTRLESEQLRVIANYFHLHHGPQSFLQALARAHSLSENGRLKSPVWNEIAEEIRRIEAPSADGEHARDKAPAAWPRNLLPPRPLPD